MRGRRSRAFAAWGLTALAVVACRRPLPPEDPGARPYHDAVVLFAKLSDDTQDLSYRDPRFDDVIALCGEVPGASELRSKADALAGRIRQARADADRLDQESARLKAQAEATPDFLPEPRAVWPVGIATPPGASNAPSAAGSTADLGSFGGSAPGAVPRPFDPSKPRPLPDWYRQKGYFGLSANGASANGTDAPTAAPADAPAAASAPAASPRAKAQPKPPAPVGPPPVFGLPGPAGRVLSPPAP